MIKLSIIRMIHKQGLTWNDRAFTTGTDKMKSAWKIRIKMLNKMRPQKFFKAVGDGWY